MPQFWVRASRFRLISIITVAILFSACNFDEIDQPFSASTNETITINLTISEGYAETQNAHKGLVCILVPKDWSFESGAYEFAATSEFAGGSGLMELSIDWADSVEAVYPAVKYGGNMRWIAFLSDSGYFHGANAVADVTVNLRTDTAEGCFDLAYIATKATANMISSGYIAYNYPNRIGINQDCEPSKRYKATPNDEWSDLFDRTSGWTGSDAAYSIPLDGYEHPDGDSMGQAMIVFGDTVIGEVDGGDKRIGAKLIRNTVGVLDGLMPDTSNITFIWDTDDQLALQELFLADTPNSRSDDWIWPMDGIAVNGKIYIFGLRLQPGGSWGFELAGATLLSSSLVSPLSFDDLEHVDAPIFYKDTTANTEIVLGQAVMPMTATSGNPNPDGYIYVYGPKNRPGSKDLVVSRVPEADFEDFTKYTYWDGSVWGDDITVCASLTSGISQEFSISPLADGRFILVFTTGSNVGIRFGDSPTGPFSFMEIVYSCPEPATGSNIFVYNAKAHPHLSKPGELLISYNVNSMSFSELFAHADIYRPRFITLDLEPQINGVSQLEQATIPMNFTLGQNFPNPFNPSTMIPFTVEKSGPISLAIYDIRGHLVINLADSYYDVGRYSIGWDGRDANGRSLESGIYIVRLSGQGIMQSVKMLLIK